MGIQIGQIAPGFQQDTTQDRTRFHDWLGGAWAVLFSHPKDFTPVCTTELGKVARLKPEFDRRSVKVFVIDPGNWQPGDPAIIMGSVSDAEATERFPQGWEAKKPYLRVVDLGKAAG